MRVTEKSFDSWRPGLAIVLLAAGETLRFDDSPGRRERRTGKGNPVGAVKAE